MKTLFILSHLDDETLSTGGLLQTLVKEEVAILTMFGRKYNYGEGEQYEVEQEEQFLLATNRLSSGKHHKEKWRYDYKKLDEGEPHSHGYYKLLKIVEESLLKFEPEQVIVHSKEDLNQDHRFLAEVCEIALRPANLGRVKRILACHGADNVGGSMNWFLPMNYDQLFLKTEAVRLYSRELRKVPHSRSIPNLEATARVTGSLCGVEYAEGYTLLMERQ